MRLHCSRGASAPDPGGMDGERVLYRHDVKLIKYQFSHKEHLTVQVSISALIDTCTGTCSLYED
jgi:hypothetical protein